MLHILGFQGVGFLVAGLPCSSSFSSVHFFASGHSTSLDGLSASASVSSSAPSPSFVASLSVVSTTCLAALIFSASSLSLVPSP